MSAAAPLRVRPAGMGDYEALCPLFDELDEFHRRARPDLFQPFPRPARSREQVARWLVDAGSRIVVAKNEEGLVGLVLLLVRPPSPFAGAVLRKVVEIDNIVVRLDQRRRRIARRLLAAAVEWARQHGATHVEVSVHAFYEEAERFYEAFGFARSISRLMLVA